MNYIENKKTLTKIRAKYGCAGEVLFRSALQYVIECGMQFFNDEENLKNQLKEIDERHDKAEAEDKVLFVTRDFEKAIIECAAEISKIDPYDLMIYLQREIWLGGVGCEEPSYPRALELVEDCMGEIKNNHLSALDCLDTFRIIGFEDDEISYFGYEYLLELEEGF